MHTEIRKNTRNTFERRTYDRRQVDFEFGSPQWIELVKENYVAWPKVDRRQATRREGERRQNSSQQPHSTTQDFSSDLLTKEERLYFNHLFMKDSDK